MLSSSRTHLLFSLCALLLVADSAASQPAAGAVTWQDTIVIVRRGQSLTTIAAHYFFRNQFSTITSLAEWIGRHNRLEGSSPITGQTLRVPIGLTETPLQAVGERDHRLPARGVYFTAQMAGSVRAMELADQVIAAGGNAIVFDIKDRAGDLSYESKVALAKETSACSLATIRNPVYFVNQLQERGLHVVARLSCFYDEQLAGQRPDLRPRSGDGGPWAEGGTPGWLDPSLEEVQEYLLELVGEVADLGVDEIQLDYVRFPTEGAVENAVFAFQPDTLAKHEVITEFVRRARTVVATRDVLLSADIFGVVAWGREADVASTGQQLSGLMPYLDVVSPMLYPSHFHPGFHEVDDPTAYPYYFVYNGCERLRDLAAEHDVTVRPWIQAFAHRVTSFDPVFVTEQMLGAEDGGATGWLLWNPKSRYEVGLEAMERYANGTAGALRRMPAP